MDNLKFIEDRPNMSRFVAVLGLNLIILFFVAHQLIICNEFLLTILFSYLLLISIVTHILLRKNFIIFEPINIFSLYYITVSLTTFYFIRTEFQTSVIANSTSFNSGLEHLMDKALFYYFVGYLFTLIGYYLIRKKNILVEIEYEPEHILSTALLKWAIRIFLCIGFGNFFLNVFAKANGNIVVYMSNISVRYLEFQTGGTTLGYIFAYNAMYIWMFLILRNKKSFSLSFVIVLLGTILIRTSTGRIFSTIVYMATFIVIYYFVELSNEPLKLKRINSRYYFTGILLLALGILIYFLRIISSMHYNNVMTETIPLTIISLMKNFGYYAFDKANTPNVVVMAKIIDSWEQDIGFLYGKSLILWITSILPRSVRPVGYEPGIMIKETWFSHIQGGALPSTGVGEMYANFGFIGPFVGMFLFGIFAAALFNIMTKKKNYWILVIYANITIEFIALYPKGEFNNLSLWMVVPILLIYASSRMITIATYKQRLKK